MLLYQWGSTSNADNASTGSVCQMLSKNTYFLLGIQFILLTKQQIRVA